MVLRGVVRSGVQQLAQRYGYRAKNYVTQEYGQVAGSIAGGAIGIIAGGDFYGAFNKMLSGGDSPYDRITPPIGYYERRNGLNGSRNGAFHKTLSPNNLKYRNYSNKKFRSACHCCWTPSTSK